MKILLVDDDTTLADVTSFALRRAGFLVMAAATGKQALQLWETESPDALILDIQLPDLDGLSVCRTIRASSTIPIVLLTVRSDDDDIVRGLELGADDYITKPFSPKQLIARLRAVLRRSSTSTSQQLTFGDLVLDTSRQMVQEAGASVRLTRLEFRLLQYLMVNCGQIIPTETLLTHVWGYSGSSDRMILKQLVYRLRTKLAVLPHGADLIETSPGIGYLVAHPEG